MKVVISGSTGLVGSALQDHLREASYEVVRLVRGEPNGKADTKGTSIHWAPNEGQIEARELDGVDAVVHLAGENIADGRWTDEKKRRIRESRVKGTELLSTTLAGLQQKPKVLVTASAVGYYGDRGDEALDESSSAGDNFLAEVCREWEAATQPAADAGIRVVCLRLGVILSRDGGVLQKMLFPFQLAAGGRVGDGQQYMSWISLKDVSMAVQFAIENEQMPGAVNLVSPNPLKNRDFAQTLGKVLKRPTLPLPAFAAKMAMGEMAEELLLASTRVYPKKLQEEGFKFDHPDLETALRFHLEK